MKKVLLASQDRIDAYESTAREFFQAILGRDYGDCVITDESRLSDLSSCGLPDELGEAAIGLKALYAAWDVWVVPVICERYGLSFGDVQPTVLLVELFEKMEEQQHRRLQ